MNSVGDRPRWEYPLRADSGQSPLPHAAGDRSVQVAHPVGPGRILEGQDSHVEGLAPPASILDSQAQKGLHGDPQGAKIVSEGRKSIRDLIEDIDPRRNRGVGGKNAAAVNRLPGLLEREMVFFHQEANPSRGGRRPNGLRSCDKRPAECPAVRRPEPRRFPGRSPVSGASPCRRRRDRR